MIMPQNRYQVRILFIIAMISKSCCISVSTTRSQVVLPEAVWRKAAKDHADRIYTLLEPGLLSPKNKTNSDSTNSYRQSRRRKQNISVSPDEWTGIDPTHPVYNFLEEYYGIKGSKGVRRLSRWSPPILDSNGLKTIHVLEGATEDDVCGGMLHLRGATFTNNGVQYDPETFFHQRETTQEGEDSIKSLSQLASPFLWYRSILLTTLSNEPVMHCHGLHEWAMLYRPPGAPQPPSAKYQSHLPLRASQETINAAVERRGISCTHVDALRFFAKDALPLNRDVLSREDQVRVEQPGCVHAHMDLLKIALRVTPWIDAGLIADALEVALEARTLDITASPYDVSHYGLKPICIENNLGRKEYRRRQEEVMNMAEPVRRKLLEAYDIFLTQAFDSITLSESTKRFPKTFDTATSSLSTN